jgi:hypothetical protein
MRAAPATHAVLDGSRGWRAVAALLGAAAAAALTHIIWLHAFEARTSLAGGLAVVLAAVVGGAWLGYSCPDGRGRLRWDGAQWWFQHADETAVDERAGELLVMLDFDSWMLLHFVPSVAGRRVWLPVGGQVQRRYPGLRAAVYSRRLKTAPNEPPRGQPTE